jgi:hypothetical protein
LPEYDDLVRRALAAQERAAELAPGTRQIRHLSHLLREASAGRVLLVRCAWCERLKVDDEWLRLTAVGSGQQRITASLRSGASHGICPDCLMRALMPQRAGLRSEKAEPRIARRGA